MYYFDSCLQQTINRHCELRIEIYTYFKLFQSALYIILYSFMFYINYISLVILCMQSYNNRHVYTSYAIKQYDSLQLFRVLYSSSPRVQIILVRCQHYTDAQLCTSDLLETIQYVLCIVCCMTRSRIFMSLHNCFQCMQLNESKLYLRFTKHRFIETILFCIKKAYFRCQI